MRILQSRTAFVMFVLVAGNVLLAYMLGTGLKTDDQLLTANIAGSVLAVIVIIGLCRMGGLNWGKTWVMHLVVAGSLFLITFAVAMLGLPYARGGERLMLILGDTMAMTIGITFLMGSIGLLFRECLKA